MTFERCLADHRSWIFIGAGVVALDLYGFVATLQPDANFGRILAGVGVIMYAPAADRPSAAQRFTWFSVVLRQENVVSPHERRDGTETARCGQHDLGAPSHAKAPRQR